MRRFLEGKAFRATGFEKKSLIFNIFREFAVSFILFFKVSFITLFYKHVPVEHAKNEVPGNGDFALLET